MTWRRCRPTSSTGPEAQESFGIQARNLARLSEAGMRVAFGTDGNAGWSPHLEMADMVASGMTPHEVIVAATGTSAEFMELDEAWYPGGGQERRLRGARGEPAGRTSRTRGASSRCTCAARRSIGRR